MATIKIEYQKPAEDIEISVGGFFTDLSSKVANVEVSDSLRSSPIIPVDLMPIYNAATASQKVVIIAWHKAIVAAAINSEYGTSLIIDDIPNTLFI